MNNTIYKIKITDLIEKYKEYKDENGKSLSHLYSSELFNFVKEIPENSSEYPIRLANFYSNIISNKKSFPFENFKDLLRYINVLFFNEIKEKLQSDGKKSKITKIKLNDLDETLSKSWKSKVKDYISEVEVLLREILKSNVKNKRHFKITMILSNDFANLLKIKNKSNNKFDILLKQYNIQCIEHDFLNKSNEFTVNFPTEQYWKDEKINSNLEKNTILLVITKKEEDFKFKINNQIKFWTFEDLNNLECEGVGTIINLDKNITNLSKANIFAIQSKVKRTSNYIKYCLQDNDCHGVNGCFHFWAPKANYKEKILIYGPNGSGKSSLIKELISQSKISENLNNQKIMVFDDNFIYKHIYQKGINDKNQTEFSHHSTIDKEKALLKNLEFHTDDLMKWRDKKKEYEIEKKQIKNDWKKWDKQLFEWFFEIISDEKNKNLKEIKEFLLTYWEKYWIDNNNFFGTDYNPKYHDRLKGLWNWSFNKLKKQIWNHFAVEKSFLRNIKSDFANEYSGTTFFIFLKRKQSQIQKNSQDIQNEIDNYQKTLKSFKSVKSISRIWGQNWILQKIKKIHNETMVEIEEILEKLNQIKIEMFDLKDEIKNIINSNKSKINFEAKKFNAKQLFEFNDKINNSFDNFFNKYLDNIKLKVKNDGYNFIAKIFKKNSLKKTILKFKYTWKWFEKNLSKKIDVLEKKIKKETIKLKTELQKELNAIQNKWNFPTKITLKYSEKLKNIEDDKNSEEIEDYSVKITGQNGQDIIEYLSIGELKSLAIVIFFLYLKRKFFKNNKKSSNKKYLIIFDDVYDGLDFAATFRFNASLKWLLDYFDENLKYRPKMMFLAHQFDFINFFHNQYRKKNEKFDFFRLFKKNETSKSKHIFVEFNLNELIQTNLMIFRKYLDKMTEQFEEHNQYKEEDLSHNLINQVIFWSISKLTLETILTHKINLQSEKVVLNRQCNTFFEKYLEKLFNKSQEEETKEEILNILKFSREEFAQKKSKKKDKFSQKYNLKENISNISKILQKNILKENILTILKKWKPKNKTFIFIPEQNDENKTFEISQKNLFLMTQTFKDFLFEIKVINQTKNKEIEKKLECFSNKYKGYNDIIATTKPEYKGDFGITIELKELEDCLKKILNKLLDTKKSEKITKKTCIAKKLQKKNLCTEEITQIILYFKEIKKEDLYIKYVLLQRAIFFLKEGYKEALKEALKEAHKKTLKEALKEVLKKTPKETPNEVLKEALKKALEETLEEKLKEAFKEKLKKAHKKTIKEALEEAHKKALKEALKEVLKETHKKAHKEALKEVLKEAYANENESQEDDSSLFTFLRHANNNFFPSLLMFDASFEKLLESEEKNKSIIIQKLLKIN